MSSLGGSSSILVLGSKDILMVVFGVSFLVLFFLGCVLVTVCDVRCVVRLGDVVGA